jgi:peroxiredoxin
MSQRSPWARPVIRSPDHRIAGTVEPSPLHSRRFNAMSAVPSIAARLPMRPPSDPRRRRVALGLLAAAALPGAACARREQVPAVGFTLLDGSAGSTVGLRGQVVLVTFWATTCALCVKKMPALAALHREFQPRGFTTLAVAMRWDPPASVARFAEARQLPFGVAIDLQGDIARAFGNVEATPTTFLLDRRGAVARRFIGEFDFADLRRRVDRLLGEA